MCYCVDKDGNEIYGIKISWLNVLNCFVLILEENGKMIFVWILNL